MELQGKADKRKIDMSTWSRLFGSGSANTPGTGSLISAERSRVRRCYASACWFAAGKKRDVTFTHSFLGIRAGLRGKNDDAVLLVLERIGEELAPQNVRMKRVTRNTTRSGH
jgi:hypothetical protein